MPSSNVAVLCDIHGNLPALQAVLLDVRLSGIDRVILGGDVVSGPMPCETLEALGVVDIVGAVMGNADREVLDPPAGDDGASWVAARLSADQRRFIQGFQPGVELELAVGRVRFCHGTPRSDEEIITPLTPDLEVLEVLGEDLPAAIVCGHIHMQYEREIGGCRLVNAGSVGMPYERAPGAYWLEIGTAITLRRADYDIDAAADTLRAGGYPSVGEYVDELIARMTMRTQIMELFEGRRRPWTAESQP